MKLRQGLESAGQFYSELVSAVGEAIGVADGEPCRWWKRHALGETIDGIVSAEGETRQALKLAIA